MVGLNKIIIAIILYKNNYVEDERLFSTGNDELDEILEEVYYSGIEDGYEYAQKEFAKAEVDLTEKLLRKALTDNGSFAIKKKYINQLPKDVRKAVMKGNGHRLKLLEQGIEEDTFQAARARFGRRNGPLRERW